MKTKILYDGNCIVCDTEISHYKKVAPDLFELLDISSDQFNADSFNVTTEAVNRHMHVITPDKKVLVGVDAFSYMWNQLPQLQFASKIIVLPGVYHLAKFFYEIFARYIRPILPKKNR